MDEKILHAIRMHMTAATKNLLLNVLAAILFGWKIRLIYFFAGIAKIL